MTVQYSYVARPAGSVQPGDVVADCGGETRKVTDVEHVENALGGLEVVIHAGDEAIICAPDHEIDLRVAADRVA